MILLWILLALIVLVWLALLQPVWVRMSKTAGEFVLEIRYLWFVLRPLESGKDPNDKPDKAKRERKSKRRSMGSASQWLKLLPDVIRAVLLSVRYLLRQILIRRFEGRLSIGTDDPAVTGLAYGICAGLAGFLPATIREGVYLESNFETEEFHLEGAFEGGLRPSSLISSGFVLLWHLPKWRMIRAIRS